MMHPVLYSISQLLFRKGVHHVVLSPGSRNAPLTISFARNPNLQVYSIVDERSAGFIALGMSLKLKQPVVICCTSGSALLNYSPAIAEAYYQQVPLIVISADRPPEWLDQRDGQTINQVGTLTNFVKKTFNFPVDLTHPDSQWEVNSKLNEAVNLATTGPKGPMHLNFPFREPFYPDPSQELQFAEPRVYSVESPPITRDWSQLQQEWGQYKRRLVVAGQQEDLHNLPAGDFVMVADVISNLESEEAIRHHDLFLSNQKNEVYENLRPELLITTGKSLISKNLKQFLRAYPPLAHWHFDESGVQVDTLQHTSKLVIGDFADFSASLPKTAPDHFSLQVMRNYQQGWKVMEERAFKILKDGFKNLPFSEMEAYKLVIKSLPSGIDLHVANSMAVRYVNMFQGLASDIRVFANRGTSGIDGSNSTAVGCSLVSQDPTWLLTGDLSFFYDRNAFFHNYDLSRLTVVVFNNLGGGIFRLINGPADQPELETFFETRHNRSCQFMASEFGFDYFKVNDKSQLEKVLKNEKSDQKAPRLIEIFIDPNHNQNVFKTIKSSI